MKRSDLLWLLGALLVGLSVRAPGVLWGYNFPTGWAIHHIDEYTHWVIAENMIDPSTPLRWYHAYPKGMAAHVAVPWIILRGLTGQLHQNAPDLVSIVVSGRVVSLIYGTLTILVVYGLARRLFIDRRIGLLSAWIFALGGLHVTQSHFFLADAAVLFWSLTGLYFLLTELRSGQDTFSPYLMAAAFSLGMAFGLKLVVPFIPGLLIVTWMRPPRLLRSIYIAVFFIAAFGVVNLFSFGYTDLIGILNERSADPYRWNRLASLWLYLLESPGLISFPILVLGILGAIGIIRRFVGMAKNRRIWLTFTIVSLPLLIEFIFVVVFRKHFLRHLIPFIPWIALAASWLLVNLIDALRLRKIHPAWVLAPLFLYLVLFVFDGERVFIQEPRNQAAAWLYQNLPAGSTYWWRSHPDLPGYKLVAYPSQSNPDFILMEMHHANHALSGLGLRNSYPHDYRYVFEANSQADVDAIQSLFKGAAGYQWVTSFAEGYFMPEYVLVNHLLGDRSRNYVTEVVIFQKNKLRE